MTPSGPNNQLILLRIAPTTIASLEEQTIIDLQKNCLTQSISSGARGMNEEQKRFIPGLLDVIVMVILFVRYQEQMYLAEETSHR
jgi:hypothetical protein